MFYITYDDKPVNEFHIFITDDIASWDEESIEFGKIYLMGMRSSKINGFFTDDEEFFVFYPNSGNFNKYKINSVTSWTDEFQKAIEFIIDGIVDEQQMRQSVETILTL